MFLARVVGTVWSTVKWPQLEGIRMLLVRPYSFLELGGTPPTLAPLNEGVVCADVLGAGVDEDVIIAYGHAARVAIAEQLGANERPNVPIDAAIVAIVDRYATGE